jgi:hypothetical protein
MGDTANEVLSGLTSVGRGVGGAIGDAGSAIGSGIGSLFGMGGQPTVPGLNQGVSGVEGNFGAPTFDAAKVIGGNIPGISASPAGGSFDFSQLNPSGTGTLTPGLPTGSLDASGGASINPLPNTDSLTAPTTGLTSPTQATAAVPSIDGASSAASASKPNGMQSLLSSLLNPKALPIALESGMLLKDVLQGQPSQEKTLKALATQQQNQATLQQNMGNAAQQGSLPQALSQQLDQQLNQRIASIKSQYAAAGMSGSSAEAADIQAATIDNQGQKFALGQQLAQSSFAQSQSDFGSAADYLQKIMAFDTAQGSELANDLANFAGMIAGTGRPGTGGISINLPAGSTVH